MRIKRTTPRSGIARRTRLIAVTAGLAAAAAVTVPTANAAGTQTFSASELKSASSSVLKADIPGTAWAIDPATDKVVVTIDSTVSQGELAKIKEAAGENADALTIKRTPGKFNKLIKGGDAIYASSWRCSLGFNVVTNDNRPAILTAGHCTAAGRQFSLTAGGRAAATVARSTFPGNGDFALLTYNNRNTNAPSEVDTGNGTVQIRRAAEAQVGRQVQRMGSTTGLRSGRITGLNATVNYPEGAVTGLIQTTVCAEGGDSGGPMFARNGDAIGLTSGGSGDCRRGGVTFLQPVTKALQAVGARIGN